MILHEVDKGEVAIHPFVLAMAERAQIQDSQLRTVTKIYLNLSSGTKVMFVEESLEVIDQFMGE